MKPKNIKDEILKLREEGISYNKISKILNCSKSTISYHCKKLDNNNNIYLLNRYNKDINQTKRLPNIDFGNDVSDDVIKEVIFYRKKRLNYKQIRIKTNLSLDKIKNICRYIKLNKNTQCQCPSDDVINEMIEYYHEVKNMKKVSKKFGWSVNTIRKYIEPIKNILSKEEYKIKRKKDVVKGVIKWRKDKKIKLVDYKGGKCQVKTCGYNKCYDSLSFHHINPNEKDFALSRKSYSFERLKKEVDKCVLVCNNCHGEIHYQIKENGYSDIVNMIIEKGI